MDCAPGLPGAPPSRTGEKSCPAAAVGRTGLLIGDLTLMQRKAMAAFAPRFAGDATAPARFAGDALAAARRAGDATAAPRLVCTPLPFVGRQSYFYLQQSPFRS